MRQKNEWSFSLFSCPDYVIIVNMSITYLDYELSKSLIQICIPKCLEYSRCFNKCGCKHA